MFCLVKIGIHLESLLHFLWFLIFFQITAIAVIPIFDTKNEKLWPWGLIMVPSLISGGFLFFFCLSKVGERLMRKIELEAACPKIGTKYLVFFSPRSLKMREKYIY